MADQLPAWVYDTVIAMQKWADNHPQLHAEFFNTEAAKHLMQPVDDCGCKPLSHVPAEVQAHARVLADYLDAKERNGTLEEAKP